MLMALIIALFAHTAAMQVSLAQKDAQLDQLAQHKAALEARMGLTGGKDAAAVAAAAVAARRGADYVSREQHEEVELELGAVKEQLLECLEELSARERELSEVRTLLLLAASPHWGVR
jgi:hypothetical protein